jgi:hypothetical protein
MTRCICEKFFRRVSVCKTKIKSFDSRCTVHNKDNIARIDDFCRFFWLIFAENRD